MILTREFSELLQKTGLFGGIAPESLSDLLNCLDARIGKYKKGALLLLAGDRPKHVGIVLTGQISVISEDINGNRSLVAALEAGDLFEEALCCAGVENSPVSVLAETDADVLLLKFDRILHTCPNSCAFHAKLIENMLRLIARKNLMMQSRMDILSTRSVREKVLKYLYSFKQREIVLPINRDQLANFLCVERTALSHELSRMKKDGLIDYNKNRFTLL